MPGVLAKLARLRRLEAEAAKRDLAAAAAAASDAQRALSRAQEAISQEASIALPAAPGAYAAWLPAAMRAVAGCKDAAGFAERTRDDARIVLGQRLAARQAVDTVLEQRAELDRIEAGRRLERLRGVPAVKKAK